MQYMNEMKLHVHYDSSVYRFSWKTKSAFLTVLLHCSGGLLRVQRVKPNLDLLPADDNTIDCAGKRCAPLVKFASQTLIFFVNK
jgi:hypothetical protein